MESDTEAEARPTCLTANIWKHGVKYEVGTPIDLLPEEVLRGLTAASVDGPLPFDTPEPPRRRKPKA